jgi:hypothetical protein
MARELLLVGSIPLDTAEQVFRTFGAALGQWLDYLLDGEIGERRYWIDGLAYRVLNGHPEIETLRRPAPDQDGVERWRPQGIHDQFQFRVKPGVKRVRFGDPGWRLGYARDAVNFYYVFCQLKKEGAIPPHLRFQVCMPLTWSAIASFFPDAEDRARVIPGFTAALSAEVAKIVEMIPPHDLAIQWDMAIENRFLEPMLAKEGLDAGRRAADEFLAPAREICSRIPEEAALGYHSCYGTLNGWPSRQPADIAGSVVLLNAAVAASGRRVDFLHFPTLGAADETFFAPLTHFEPGVARVYVGAIHHMHDDAGLREQLKVVRRYLPEFGLAAPCGFGRAPERPGKLLGERQAATAPAIVSQIVADHRRAVDVLCDVMQT